MNKNEFFEKYKTDEIAFKMPDGETIPLFGLTLEQRAEVRRRVDTDPIIAEAYMVAMSCPLFSEEDIDAIKALPGDLVSRMSSRILKISGFDTDEDDEKN